MKEDAVIYDEAILHVILCNKTAVTGFYIIFITNVSASTT